eukprot:gene1242-905_t
MSSLWSAVDELAPLPVVLEALHNDKSLGWPSVSAQDQVASWLSAKETYPLPPKYLLALMKALEKDISTSRDVASAKATNEEDEEQFSDEFLSYFLTVRSIPLDDEDSGYQQFEVRGSSQKLPIAIKRSHNQVGTKVWSAGLLLAEILQHECGFDCTTSLVDKCFVELGAGVGISSLLWFFSLPPEKRMADLVITDYAWSVIDLVDRNIEIARSLFGDEDTDGNIRSALMDWAMLSEDDLTIVADADCLLAADCTYSPDLNTLLVQLFQTYFKLRLERRYLARVKGRFPEQLLQLLHPLEESEIYHYAGDAGDGDEADDGGDAAAADGAAVEGDAPPSHGKKRPSTAEPPGASSSAATGASRAERKRQRQEQYGATTGPSAASAACAASATDGPVAAGAVVHVAGKSADCAAHRTAPALDDVRAHPAVGYYRRRDAGDGDGDGDGDDAYFYVQCPLDVVSKRNGVHACYPPPYGRPSVTKMRLVSFCAASQTSLVECQPVTGRTHQIRLHSQLAGHPIANDPCYGGELFYHDPEKQAQCRAAQELLEACGIAPLSRVLHQPTTAPASAATPATWALPAIERRVGETDDALLERSCRYCAALRQFPQLRDVEVHLHCDGIWLHAWQYAKTRPPPPSTATEGRGGGGGGDEGDEFWAFEAPPPAWAADTLPLPLAATAAAAAAAVPVPSTATDAAPPSR